MKKKIYCKPTEKGIHSFYLVNGKEEFYLFSQAYRKGVEKYYGRGVIFDEAMSYSRAHNDSAITRTMDKIPIYIRYIEKQYGITVFNRAKRKNQVLKAICV